MTLKPRGERRDDVSAVVVRLKQRVASIPGMTIYFQPVQDVQISTQSSRSQYQYTLTGTDSALVSLWANNLVAEMRRDPLFRDVSSEAQDGGLRADLNIDRQRAGQLGVNLQAVTDTLNDAFAQRQISTIYGQANQYRVVLEALPMYQRDPSILSKLYLPGALDAQVPLSAIATLTRTTAPLAISHQAQFPAISLSFNLAPGAGARRRRRCRQVDRNPHRHARQHRRRVCRRRRRVLQIAGGPTVADPGRAGHDLHRARCAL